MAWSASAAVINSRSSISLALRISRLPSCVVGLHCISRVKYGPRTMDIMHHRGSTVHWQQTGHVKACNGWINMLVSLNVYIG